MEHAWAIAWARGIAFVRMVDAIKGSESHPRPPRHKKRLRMIVLGRIGLCLSSVVWRESRHMVRNETHRNGREEKKTGRCHEQDPTECHDHNQECMQIS